MALSAGIMSVRPMQKIKNPAASSNCRRIFLLEGNYGATVGVPISAGSYGVAVNIEVGVEKSVGVEVYFWMIVGMTVGV